MREALNIILINLVIFFVLISIHEAAHALAGFYLSCKQSKVVLFDAKGPYTELVCSTKATNWLLYVSSLVATTLFGSIFLLLRSPSKNLFFLIIGFSLIFSALDLSLFFNSELFYVAITFGLGFMTGGEYLIASSCVKTRTPK